MEAHPDANLKEIAEVFGCHPSSALRRLTMLDITQKPPPKKKNQVEAYLEEKLKTFPKKSSYIIDDTCIQMQMYRHVYAVNGENGRIFASVASGIVELGVLRRYVRGNRSILFSM